MATTKAQFSLVTETAAADAPIARQLAVFSAELSGSSV